MTQETKAPAMPQRNPEDYTLPYLVENVQLLEDYLATMLQMIVTHHPYLGPAASAIGNGFQERHNALQLKYPVSAIVLPPAGLTVV
jgi:hypothetical protein